MRWYIDFIRLDKVRVVFVRYQHARYFPQMKKCSLPLTMARWPNG